MLRFKKPEERAAQRTLTRVLLLVNRMLVFVQRYLHFVTVEVIDPQWHIMMSRISDADSIDEVRPTHAAASQSPMDACIIPQNKSKCNRASCMRACSTTHARSIRGGRAVRVGHPPTPLGELRPIFCRQHAH